MHIALVFLSNEFVHPSVQDAHRIPMNFVTFALIEGKMYRHFRAKGTFATQEKIGNGNSAVYGAIYHIPDFHFYSRLLDAYHVCSMSTLGRNHLKDTHHRIRTTAFPITLNCIDEFERLRFYEGEGISVFAYVGNLRHPILNRRIKQTSVSYRVLDGIDEKFTQLLREVLPHEHRTTNCISTSDSGCE